MIPFSYEVAGAGALGVHAGAVDELLVRVRREIDEGLLPSCQIALARDGRLVLFETLGEATPESRYVVFSCTKGIVAGAVWLLIGDGRLDVGTRVADLVPEFATNEKETVTVEQLLLHTAGFPRAPLGPPDWADREARLSRFAKWRLNWEPGSRLEYHPTSAHWVLAEIIERLSGMDYRRFVDERICRPLGLRRFKLGLTPEEQGDINLLHSVGLPPTSAELEALTGIAGIDVAAITTGDIRDDMLLLFNEPANRAVGVPGGGAVATAADMALYYQALLHNPCGLWDAGVLADATSRVRVNLVDVMSGVAANRGLGVVIAGGDGNAARRGFGHHCSPRAFGHNGAGGQIAWADPETGLTFSYLTNGLDANFLRSARRSMSISSRAAKCAPAAVSRG